jgi:hypothetical protein
MVWSETATWYELRTTDGLVILVRHQSRHGSKYTADFYAGSWRHRKFYDQCYTNLNTIAVNGLNCFVHGLL